MSFANYVWFAGVGTALVLSIGVLFIHEYLRVWKDHQAIAKRLQLKSLESRMDALASEANRAEGEQKKRLEERRRVLSMAYAQIKATPRQIQQIQLEQFKKVDRCTTCHFTVEDKGMLGQPQPYGGHPGAFLDWHEVQDFGCTICHEGQGLSTDYMQAAHKAIRIHGSERERPWPRGVQTKYLLQSSCGKCHLTKDVPYAPLLTKGRGLIEKAGCYGCHQIRLYEDQEKIAPTLDRLGSKVDRAWLLHWLNDPREYAPATGEGLVRSRMPRFDLTKEDILCLTEFLMGSKDEQAMEEPPAKGNPERGGLLFREIRCVTCHTVGGKGGYISPELEQITTKVSRKWAYNWLINTHYFDPKTKMPQFDFTKEQAVDVVDHLWEEFGADQLKPPEGFQEAEEALKLSTEERMTRGKKLFSDKGCAGCHPHSGMEREGKIGRPLEKFAQMDEETLDWGKIDRFKIEPYVGNWIYMRLLNPKDLAPEGKMPHFSLTEAEAALVALALLSDTGDKIPPKYLVEEKPGRYSRPPYPLPYGGVQGVAAQTVKEYPEPPGEFGRLVDRYRCRSCHVVFGKGGWVSTHPLDMEGSQVQEDWLRHYFDMPYSLRPILKERMLNLKMEPEEPKFITEFFKAVSLDNSISPTLGSSLTAEEAQRGKGLFVKKGCRACHIVEGKGGFVGAALDKVGDRLTAGWTYAFLKDPQRYKPWVIQPDYGLTDQETRELTAYLMTLKDKGRVEKVSEHQQGGVGHEGG
ncbi:MAG TPA: c-type cytochrome [Candidatus Tripitaka californicus]|uniref:c-type cytochrome n=2 Tax=Candidatus Tripitaka californicus TaxID=3367616 RepID=UPI004027BCD8